MTCHKYFAIFMVSEVMMNLLIAGIQGSGKGTHAKAIAKRFNLRHISFGDTIKHYLDTDPEFVLPYSLEKYNRGELAPNEVLYKVADAVLNVPMSKRLDNGFILDGFPRTHSQMDYVLNNVRIDLCIMLTLPEDVVTERLLKRGRSDDTPEGIKKRLSSFKEFTLPIFKSLEDSGKIITTETNRPFNECSTEIIEKIENWRECNFFQKRV